MSEDEYYSVEGRKRLIDGILKLNKKLQEQLGKERTQFYAEVRELGTGYYMTWQVLTANGISEDRVSEFREMADEFNRQMHGYPLFRAERDVARYLPDDFRIDYDGQKQIAKSFRDRIEKEFGKQILDDVLSLRGSSFFMDNLDKGDPKRFLSLLHNLEQRERLENLYDVEFGEDDGTFERSKEERERLAKRERELRAEWIKHHAQQQAEPEEASGDSP